ncbi:DUF2851 family protein [Tenacibaculum geojense]|uniref:DUF2851 family protein n=1 Tax=Tenacibaculum geojense TaxID=915352 RepID=A0ABW3JUK4_9FLAO
MKEDFLHYVWQYKLFTMDDLYTTNHQKIQILKQGTHNNNSGPDFLQAKIKIGTELWVGNVEIHLKSSDWYAHHHEKDNQYNAVILHVVYENDMPVYIENNQELPTLVIKNHILTDVYINYQKLFSQSLRWIPCEPHINSVDSFLLSNWKERLFIERLEQKSVFIKKLLASQNNNFEVVLFQLLCKNFGLKVNADAFFNLATAVDYGIIRKVQHNDNQLSALLFGQAGFLEETTLEDPYYKSLQEEYKYLQHKFRLKSISKINFQFFRMRPANFPTIRLAQLIGLYHHHHNLFVKLMNTQSLEDFYNVFNISIHEYWKTHYTFDKTSKKSAKKITKSMVDLLVINTIVPLQFVWQQSRGALNQEKILQLIKEIKPEKNAIISKFSDIKIPSNNAFETQALLQLKNNYCTLKRCLQCAIGNSLINN